VATIYPLRVVCHDRYNRQILQKLTDSPESGFSLQTTNPLQIFKKTATGQLWASQRHLCQTHRGICRIGPDHRGYCGDTLYIYTVVSYCCLL